jgi:cytochrome c oxidase assembly protein subunit 15
MSKQPSPSPHRRLQWYVLLVLVATLSINLLSAYIRHLEAGLGCADWPACYGQIGDYIEPSSQQSVSQMALAPVAAAKKIHRGVATALVILVLLLLQEARKQKQLRGVNRNLPYIMVAVLLLLSVVGPASYLKTLPAIAVVNLLGGMTLLALAWWLYLQLQGGAPTVSRPLRLLARAGLLALLVQITLGIWLSANFAAISCSSPWSCNPPMAVAASPGDSFWYFRELRLSASGQVVFDQGMQVMHIAHRLGALLSGVLLLVLAAVAWRRGGPLRPGALVLALLLLLQLLLGVAAMLAHLPLALVLAHNLVASLLLLAVLKLNYLAREEARAPSGDG